LVFSALRACAQGVQHHRSCYHLRRKLSPFQALFHQTMHVEFLGVPRERAGVTGLDVHAETLGQLLTTLASRLPSLAELIISDRLHPACVANLNGDEFVSDPATPLAEHDSVLILSADVGG
jgi:molybdopterin converting factor small subunit